MKKLKINEIGSFSSVVKRIHYLRRSTSKGGFFFPLDESENENESEFILTKKTSNNLAQLTPGILLKYNQEKDEVKPIFAYANLLYSSEIDLGFYLSVFGKEGIEKKIPYICYLVVDEYILGEFDLKKEK